MHLEAVIKRGWRYVLEGQDRVNLDTAIKRVW
jgi:hypothetical protein